MINKDMKISDMMEKYPEAVSVLVNKGVGCVGCMLATAETIGEGLSAHGLDADAIVKEMNEKVKA